jgi:TonB family protein
VVFLPRELPLTIDAYVENGANHHIIADPALSLEVQYDASGKGQALRTKATANGGGQTLHLRAIAGNIHLRVLDAATEQRLVAEQSQIAERRLKAQKALLVELDRAGTASASAAPSVSITAKQDQGGAGRFPAITRLLEELWWGGVRVGPEEQQKRILKSSVPAYPDAARAAGIEGEVILRVLVDKTGSVSSVETLSGNAVLARAATSAVEQWRYEPMIVSNRPVRIVTTVSLAFRLRPLTAVPTVRSK